MNDQVQYLPGMIGRHPLMLNVYRLGWVAARTDTPALIVGESGTGKELVARAIHSLGRRASSRLLAINCAALPESLIEVELFGVEAGAYTDARRTRDGLLAQANGTTVLLDELCSLPLSGQAKLLRVLQSGEYRRVGGRSGLTTNARFLATVSEDPARLVARRRLRLDLFYRLAVIDIHVPPLRDRRSDIAELARAFLAAAPDGRGRRLGTCAEAMLMERDWPGNVRELEWVMVRASVCLTGSTILADELRPLLGGASGTPPDRPRHRPAPSPMPNHSVELRGDRQRLSALVTDHGGYVALAARAAGVPRTTLLRWLQEVGLTGRAPRGRPNVAVQDQENVQWTF